MNSPSHNQNQVSSAAAPAGGSCLYALGGGVTVLYLLGLLLYAWAFWDKFIALEPNELGDFLAGGFAPLAFAWLVLGFMQQGIELRQNSYALRLQAEELRAAAQHAGSMVELQRTDIELRLKELEDAKAAQEKAEAEALELAERKRLRQKSAQAQPNFRIELDVRKTRITAKTPTGTATCVWFATLINEGKSCTDVRVVASSEHGTFEAGAESSWERFLQHAQESLILADDSFPGFRLGKVIVHFVDELGVAGCQVFSARINQKSLELIKETEISDF